MVHWRDLGFMPSGDARFGICPTVDPCVLLFERNVLYKSMFPGKAESGIVTLHQ